MLSADVQEALRVCVEVSFGLSMAELWDASDAPAGLTALAASLPRVLRDAILAELQVEDS